MSFLFTFLIRSYSLFSLLLYSLCKLSSELSKPLNSSIIPLQLVYIDSTAVGDDYFRFLGDDIILYEH
jgi:hypothetical protein